MVKRLKKLTVEEALDLPEDAVIVLQDENGSSAGMGYRHLFQNSGPNRGSWGWIFGSKSVSEIDFIDELQSLTNGDGETIGLKGRKTPLFVDFESKVEHDDDVDLETADYKKWADASAAVIRELPVGSIVEIQGAEPLGLKVGDGTWSMTGCGWTSDQDAQENQFATAASIATPEAASEL